VLLGTGHDRVSEILRLVGLDDKAAAKRVRDYSLGMRQRLALGNALLGVPGHPHPRRACQRAGQTLLRV
jgi:ABC-2 type transport system ATP-binding protein